MWRSTTVLMLALAAAASLPSLAAQDGLDQPPGWDQEKAAQYLDERMDLWFTKATKLRSGDSTVSCNSCHMVVPYLLARPALRAAMRVKDPTPQETRLLLEITRRVETAANQEPLFGGKAEAAQGTESVLNALLLAHEDVQQHRSRPSEITGKAFRQLWEQQRPDGAWAWADFGMEPDESRDARYYGAALAALAVGSAPGLVDRLDGKTARQVDQLRTYLKRQYAAQNLYHRTWMLLASTRLTGLLTREERAGLMDELRNNQNSDGGWSLGKLGPWRWSKTVPPFAAPGKPEPALGTNSDGYATGLIVYAFRQAGLPAGDRSVQQATDWLKNHQIEVNLGPYRWKCWRAYSLNHDREHGGAHGELWKQMLMSDAATGFAVLGLLPSD